MYEVEPLPATPWRRRLLILACAVATVYMILSQVTARPGAPDWKPPATADKPRCAPGQTTDCVGGVATVIVTPAAAPAPVPASPAASPAGR